METTPIIPVDLDDYRSEIDRKQATYHAAMRRADLARDALKETVVAAIGHGLSENEATKLAGVARDTVRSWQGKK